MLEKANEIGGLAKTIHHNGSSTDIGPHLLPATTEDEQVAQLIELESQDIQINDLTDYDKKIYFDWEFFSGLQNLQKYQK